MHRLMSIHLRKRTSKLKKYHHAIPWQKGGWITPEPWVVFSNGLRSKPENAVLYAQKCHATDVFQWYQFPSLPYRGVFLGQRKHRRITQVYNTRVQIGLYVQMVCKAWQLKIEKTDFHRVSNVIAPHMCYVESQMHFILLSKCFKRYLSLQ